MSHLERANTNGHAKINSEGRQRKIIGVIGRAPLSDPHVGGRLPA